MSPRELLITALSDAAEIEHSITCQYLYAAFSLKTHPEEGGVDWPKLERIRAWKADILSVARQEMAHHGLVCNLLLALGGAPHLGRVHFPHPVRYCPPYTTFELLPFSEEALDRFACYERLHAPPPDGSPPSAVRSIGDLYRVIRGALEHAYRSTPNLFIGPLEHQITNLDLRIGEGQFDVVLVPATDLPSALALLDHIREHDHHERFLTIQRDLAELRRQDPAFEPARPVVRNPRVHLPQDASGAATALRHPHTRAAAELFNAAYEVMVLMLTRIYGRSSETAAETEGLIGIAFFPLMTAVIRPLGEILTRMPVEDGAAATAGPCFELPFGLPLQPSKRGAWVFLYERLQAMAASSGRLSVAVGASSEPWAPPIAPRLALLHENLDRLARSFAQHMGLERDYSRQTMQRLR
ncbi:ferritin-like domain-containing protein [Sorangium sp. So ce1182]|uniref:ferritin-like domain-containing protein n=1 Tax=Sorangium sp. So ce1182 TaxID=3133334 RepID=UPI003F622685